MLFRSRSLLALIALAFMSVGAAAQTQSPPPATQPTSETEQPLKPAELEALVAPIALYPDSLLSLVMMASTYPLEVVQADRWLTGTKLKGDELKAAVDKQGWDESVKSLTVTPSVLSMMSTKLDWTQKLGDAVLAQQEDVMDAVQRLRARAESNDKLKSTKEQTVTTTQVDNRPVIAIAQTDPNTVYVPVYDPGVAYGTWPYAEYPPYYWPDYWAGSGYLAGGVLATGLVFGAGYALGRWASGGNWWGGGVNWGNRNLIVNRPGGIGNNWQHRPEHRHGVRYNNVNVAQKFAGGNNLRSSAGQRQDFRGKDGNRPGGDRAGLGGDRPGGDRAAWERTAPVDRAIAQARTAPKAIVAASVMRLGRVRVARMQLPRAAAKPAIGSGQPTEPGCQARRCGRRTARCGIWRYAVRSSRQRAIDAWTCEPRRGRPEFRWWRRRPWRVGRHGRRRLPWRRRRRRLPRRRRRRRSWRRRWWPTLRRRAQARREFARLPRQRPRLLSFQIQRR